MCAHIETIPTAPRLLACKESFQSSHEVSFRTARSKKLRFDPRRHLILSVPSNAGELNQSAKKREAKIEMGGTY